MTKIKVTIYEKTEGHCPNCVLMRARFDAWLADNGDKRVGFETLSAEEHRDKIMDLGANSAPVYVIERGKTETVVFGRNPDVLIDSLEGLDTLWE